MEKQTADVLQEAVRINRFLAMAGFSSRRKAEEMILNGEVTVNKKIITDLATKIIPSRDVVTVNGMKVRWEEHLVYIILNKPNDYITTAKDEKGRKTVFDLLKVKERVFPVGRLDRKTTGVLIFTNDGMLAHALMHPSHGVEKSYRVSLEEPLDSKNAAKLRKGIHLEDGKSAPASVESIPGTKNKEVIITIHEGKNRLVRRMFESLGCNVKKLDRIFYAGLSAEGLARGRWRFLSRDEINHLRKKAGLIKQEKLI